LTARCVERTKAAGQPTLLDAVIDLVIAVVKRAGPPTEQNDCLIAAQHIAANQPLGERLGRRLRGLLGLSELGRQLLHLLRGQQAAFGQEPPEIRDRNAHGIVIFLANGSCGICGSCSYPAPSGRAEEPPLSLTSCRAGGKESERPYS